MFGAVTPPPATKFAALHHPDYRRYFVFGVLGMVGENIEHVISYWVIFQLFHSPALAGFAVVSHWVPYLLFSVYAGSLADRFDCRRLIQISEALFMLASLAWGVLFWTGRLRMWHTAAILIVHGVAGVISSPAIQLIIHDIVGPDRLQSAVRLNATSRYLAILLGPAVGGGMMLLLGPAGGLVANVLLYVPLIVFLQFLRYTGHTAGSERRAHRVRFGFAETWEVLAEARADARIVTMIVMGGAASLFVGSAFQAQMPEYAHHLGADGGAGWYSVLLAANAAGAVIGAVLLESITAIQASARLAIVCAGAWGVFMAFFPMARSYAAAVTLLVLAGIFNIGFTSMAQTLVQVLAPARLRGRIVGLFNSSVLGLRAGSGVTVGFAGAIIGIEWSLALSAAAVVLVALTLLIVDMRTRVPATSAT